MKAYNKSEIMKRAHSIYKKYRYMFPTFSSALIRAWEIEKANIAKAIRDAEIATSTWVPVTGFQFNENNHADSLTNYYNEKRRYYGD